MNDRKKREELEISQRAYADYYNRQPEELRHGHDDGWPLDWRIANQWRCTAGHVNRGHSLLGYCRSEGCEAEVVRTSPQDDGGPPVSVGMAPDYRHGLTYDGLQPVGLDESAGPLPSGANGYLVQLLPETCARIRGQCFGRGRESCVEVIDSKQCDTIDPDDVFGVLGDDRMPPDDIASVEIYAETNAKGMRRWLWIGWPARSVKPWHIWRKKGLRPTDKQLRRARHVRSREGVVPLEGNGFYMKPEDS